MSHKRTFYQATLWYTDCRQTQMSLNITFKSYQLLNWQLYDGKRREPKKFLQLLIKVIFILIVVEF